MLCQAILTREYPGVQCYPVAMPDGGRDAAAGSHASRDLIVFQIKYARDPAKITDVAKWVTDAIEGELPKINRLSERGVSRYILMTNVKGTSHLDSGSIDKVQSYIDQNLPCPGQCLWRDDLDRRLDDAYDLKLRYPSLIAGPDALRLMMEKACAGEGAERRRRALNSYIGHQYKADRVVRFKQADLPASSLFSLFVDVPINTPRPRGDRSKSQLRAFHQMIRDTAQNAYVPRKGESADNMPFYYRSFESSLPSQFVIIDNNVARRVTAGAASLLLYAPPVESMSQIVIEGAPGQGKSTLAQYLAQVHRYRLMNRPFPADRLSSQSASSPLNLPFKIELRDVAQWLDGFDPWQAERKVSHDKERTLEKVPYPLTFRNILAESPSMWGISC